MHPPLVFVASGDNVPVGKALYKAFGLIPHDLIVATSATTTNVRQRLKLTRN